MTTKTTSIQTALGCPDWCPSVHDSELALMEEREYRQRVHFSPVGRIANDAGENVAWVDIVRRDDLDTGERGQVQVCSGQDDLLDADQAVRFVALVLRAVELAKEANA